MSILINMEMPKNCCECPMANKYDGYGPLQGCLAVQGKEYAAIDERYDEEVKPSWCPLIEVPKHGDLIDRDALIKNGWSVLHKQVMRMGGYAIHELPLKNPTIPVVIEKEKEDG